MVLDHVTEAVSVKELFHDGSVRQEIKGVLHITHYPAEAFACEFKCYYRFVGIKAGSHVWKDPTLSFYMYLYSSVGGIATPFEIREGDSFKNGTWNEIPSVRKSLHTISQDDYHKLMKASSYILTFSPRTDFTTGQTVERDPAIFTSIPKMFVEENGKIVRKATKWYVYNDAGEPKPIKDLKAYPTT